MMEVKSRREMDKQTHRGRAKHTGSHIRYGRLQVVASRSKNKEMEIWTKVGHSLAHINPLRNSALLTEHVAAPVEAAVTPFAACLFEDVVSAAAAQRPAAVHAGAALVADATLRAQRVHLGLVVAEVRGLLEEH